MFFISVTLKFTVFVYVSFGAYLPILLFLLLLLLLPFYFLSDGTAVQCGPSTP
jgi:hypothetical protein